MLALQRVAVDTADERRETTVQRAGVHVATSLGARKAGLDGLLVQVLRERNKGLLDVLVGQGCFVRDVEELLRDVGEERAVGVRLEVGEKLNRDENEN